MDDDGEVVLRSGELNRFLYTCPLGLMLTDSVGGIRLLNGAAISLLAPYCLNGAMENFFEFLKRWEPDAIGMFRSLIGTSRTATTLVHKLRLQPPHGAAVWVELHVSPFADGLSIACRDITETVAREAELSELSHSEAQQRGRAEMAAAILHDMGNALTGIGGRIVAMRAIVDDTQVLVNLKRLARLLERSVQALDGVLGASKGSRVVDMLQTMHELGTGAQTELRDSMSVLETYLGHAQELLTINRTYATSATASVTAEIRLLFRDARDMTLHACRKRGGSLALSIFQPTPRVQVDRSKIMQLILNMIENALEAWDTDESGVALQLSLSCKRHEDGGIVIEVKDNGCGFEPERAESFFERGFSTKERFSGLGLYACRQLAHSMHGHLTLMSPGPGKGATCSLHLPSEIVTYDDAPT